MVYILLISFKLCMFGFLTSRSQTKNFHTNVIMFAYYTIKTLICFTCNCYDDSCRSKV